MAPDLLELLDAFVKSDPRPPGLLGELAIGAGDRWLRISFGARTVTNFSHEPPERADATLHLTAEDATAIVRGRPATAPKHYTGDRALLKKLFDRYLAGRTR